MTIVREIAGVNPARATHNNPPTKMNKLTQQYPKIFAALTIGVFIIGIIIIGKVFDWIAGVFPFLTMLIASMFLILIISIAFIGISKSYSK
jgi:hypothetical protein